MNVQKYDEEKLVVNSLWNLGFLVMVMTDSILEESRLNAEKTLTRQCICMRVTQLAVIAQLLGFAAGKSLSTQGVYLRATLCSNTKKPVVKKSTVDSSASELFYV